MSNDSNPLDGVTLHVPRSFDTRSPIVKYRDDLSPARRAAYEAWAEGVRSVDAQKRALKAARTAGEEKFAGYTKAVARHQTAAHGNLCTLNSNARIIAIMMGKGDQMEVIVKEMREVAGLLRDAEIAKHGERVAMHRWLDEESIIRSFSERISPELCV